MHQITSSDHLRQVSKPERELLAFLLSPDDIPQVYRDQIESVQVSGCCGCGCPTIELAVDSRSAALSSESEILAEMFGTSPEGVTCGVLLHAREGLLSELEAYSLDDVSTFTFPAVSSLAFAPAPTKTVEPTGTSTDR